GAAVGRVHRDAEPAGLGERRVKVGRKPARAIAFEPVVVAEAFADFLDRAFDRALVVGQVELHGLLSWKWASGRAALSNTPDGARACASKNVRLRDGPPATSARSGTSGARTAETRPRSP